MDWLTFESNMQMQCVTALTKRMRMPIPVLVLVLIAKTLTYLDWKLTMDDGQLIRHNAMHNA